MVQFFGRNGFMTALLVPKQQNNKRFYCRNGEKPTAENEAQQKLGWSSRLNT